MHQDFHALTVPANIYLVCVTHDYSFKLSFNKSSKKVPKS